MKGTATLTLDETYNERKAFILSCIVVARKLIKTLSANIDKYPQLEAEAFQVIKQEKQYINDQLTELTKLERWRVREGLEKHEPYIYPSIRKRIDQRNRREQDHALHLERARESGNNIFWTIEACLECQASNNSERSAEAS